MAHVRFINAKVYVEGSGLGAREGLELPFVHAADGDYVAESGGWLQGGFPSSGKLSRLELVDLVAYSFEPSTPL